MLIAGCLVVRARRRLVPALATLHLLVACSSGGTASNSTVADASDEVATLGSTAQATTYDLGAVGNLDSDELHDISLTFDRADYDGMIEVYKSSEEKGWIEATVAIDGATYERVGVRLKGNSSLRALSGRGGGPPRGPGGVLSADEPETLPWLIKIDRFVKGQNHHGLVELVVRSNNSVTSLNEAVALELLELAGLASQDAIETSFSVNGSNAVLRLVIENPDDVWMAENFDDSGALYKAESSGDYRYRGDDPESYAEVFDQEAGKDNADLAPLIEFLDFINNSDDAAFANDLRDRLDVAAFATYLAMQQLVDNFDDIDGPGNNSYLYYDTVTNVFTVVPWDMNLAFGALNGGPPGNLDDGDGGGGFGGGGFRGRSNALVERFLANPEFEALYESRISELRSSLYDSGAAEIVLNQWTTVVASSPLVDESGVASEAEMIGAKFN